MDKIKVLFGIFIFVILISNVYSLGISPGRTTIEFVPGLEKQVEFQVINTENKDINIALSVEGSLKDYVNVSDEVVSLSKVESSKKFNYSINLPNELPPGLNTANVMALELPKDINDPGMVLQATVAVITQVYVYVPYPGKYAEVALSSHNVNAGEPVNLYLTIISRGKDDIIINPEIEIFSENESVEKFSLEQSSVKSQQSTTLKKVLNTTSYKPGLYTALALVSYEAGSAKTASEFKIGTLFVSIINYTGRINIGGISKFQVWIESNWNSRIDSIYANILITKKENSIVLAGFKTPYTTLEQWGTGMLEGFFDAGNFTAGNYNANITLFYAGNSSSSIASIEFASKESRLMIIVIIAAAVVIALIAIAFLARRFMLKNAKEKERKKRKDRKGK